eukprot:gene19743-21681_t
MLAELKTELKKQIAVPTIINVKEIDTSGFYKMADEEMIVSGSSTQADEKFDNTIGALEDILWDSQCQLFFRSRKDQMDLEIFDMLQTLTDFLEFKQMFLDYKATKEGKAVDFSPG